MAWSITLNGTTYTDADFANYGYITKLPAMLADAVADFAVYVAAALGYANAAAASAASAIAAPGTSSTSATSLLIATGAKTLAIQTGKSLVPGQPILLADAADPATNWMWGRATDYDGVTGALSVSVTAFGGSGTKAAWIVSLSPNPSAASGSTSNPTFTASQFGGF